MPSFKKTTIRGVAGRLESVQEAVSGSLTEFRDQLNDRSFWAGAGKPSPVLGYETMRRYHSDKQLRDPPTSYLVAVVERFDVNPAWLLTGKPEGVMFMSQVREAQAAQLTEADHALWPPALRGAPKLADWPTAARVLFLAILEDYLVSFEGHELVLWELSEERRMEAFEALAADLFDMVTVNYHSMRPLDMREFREYLIAMLHAVQLRIPDHGEGPHIFTRFNTLDPEYREAMQAAGVDESTLDAPLTEAPVTRWKR